MKKGPAELSGFPSQADVGKPFQAIAGSPPRCAILGKEDCEFIAGTSDATLGHG
jgi:hypothetical protein